MYEKEDGEVEKVDGLMGVLRPLFVSENVFGEPLLEVFQAYAIAKRAKDINDSGRQSPVPQRGGGRLSGRDGSCCRQLYKSGYQ